MIRAKLVLKLFCEAPYFRKASLCQLNPNLNFIIIKFRYNARSDWLKERALSEYRARSDEGGPISVFASAF